LYPKRPEAHSIFSFLLSTYTTVDQNLNDGYKELELVMDH
jgi:hypothetical protein